MRTLLYFESATYRTKAHRALTRANISAEPYRITSDKGCTHALIINGSDLFSAVSILRIAKINYQVGDLGYDIP